MKPHFLRVLLLCVTVCIMNSCSSDSASSMEPKPALITKYTYNSFELEVMTLINNHRVSNGLNPLEKINHISYKSEEHDNYMIANNVVNHNDFVARSENIMSVLGAKRVSENVAYNYNSPKAVVDAWLNSPEHKVNILGDFTHFGLSVRENPSNGAKYYTNIFAKI